MLRTISFLRRRPSLSLMALAGLIVLAGLARVPLFPLVAYMAPEPQPFSDSAVWESWSRDLYYGGLGNLSDIKPETYVGFHYILWAVAHIYALFSPDYELGTKTLLYLIKVPEVIADLALIPVIFVATRMAARLLPEGLAAARTWTPVRALERRGMPAEDTVGLAGAAVFAFSPAVMYDSAVWAQSESLISICMLGAVLALVSRRIELAWALWAIGFVIKPQPIVIVPALVAFTYWQYGWHGIARGAIGTALGGFGSLGYLLATGNGPYIWKVYQTIFVLHDQQISVNAWNLWWPAQQIAGLRASDALLSIGPLDITVRVMSFVLLTLSTLLVLAYMEKRRDLVGLLVGCAMLEFAFYLFPISTHERYLYPFFVFLAPLLFLQPRWLLVYVPLSAIFFLNIFFASPTDPDWSKAALNSWFGYAMSIVNVVLFAAVALALSLSAGRSRPWPDIRRALRTAPAA